MVVDVEEWYKKYGPMVMRRCMKLLRDEQLAIQAMQDVFVKVLNYKERIKDEYPSGLLYRIATNLCLNIIRDEKKNIHPQSEEILNTIATYDEIENKSIFGILLDQIFLKEDESTRVIATLYFVDKMTWSEVASTVNMSVSGVRKRMRVFTKKIKEQEGVLNG